MKTTKTPAPMQEPRQLNLLFESSRLTGLSIPDRSKASKLLAQIPRQRVQVNALVVRGWSAGSWCPSWQVFVCP